MARFWWRLRRPCVTGTLVAIVVADEVLCVHASYRTVWSLPGGSEHPGEQPADTGRREILEETGVTLPDPIQHVWTVQDDWEYRLETIHFLVARLPYKPPVEPDRREIVETRWLTVDDALRLPLPPHVREFLHRNRDVLRLERRAAMD